MRWRKEIINAIKRSDEKMDNFLQSITQSEPSFVENSIIEKMKEVEDRCKHVDERIANTEKKFSMLDEKSEIKNDGPSNV